MILQKMLLQKEDPFHWFPELFQKKIKKTFEFANYVDSLGKITNGTILIYQYSRGMDSTLSVIHI